MYYIYIYFFFKVDTYFFVEIYFLNSENCFYFFK